MNIISPQLDISGVPANTQSLAQPTSIASGTTPPNATQGDNDFGQPGYGGPCPGSGKHRYQFKLYALDTRLDLSSKTPRADLEAHLPGHTLDQTKLTGLYQRRQLV